MGKKTENEIVEKPQGQVILGSDYAEDAGAGFENQTGADKSLPFLNLLQTGSPQVKPRDEKQIKGAVAGMMLNSVTEETHDGEKGLVVIPCFTDRKFCEWKPRQGGGAGGFVAAHEPESRVVLDAIASAKDKYELKVNGNDLVDTFYMYALAVDSKLDLRNGWPATVTDLIDVNLMGTPIIIPFSSTKIKPYRTINSQLGMYCIPGLPHPQNKPPMWAFPLWFTTALEHRDAGDSFNYRIKYATGARIELSNLLPRRNADGSETALYSAGRELKKLIEAGTLKVDYSKSEGRDSGGSSDSQPRTTDDIPF